MTTDSEAPASPASFADARGWRYPFAVADPWLMPAEFTELRRLQPVARVRMAGSGDPVYLVTRYDDVRAVLSDQRFSRNLARPDTARMIDGVRQPSSPFADPPNHTRWRRLVAKAFTARRVEGLRPRVQAIVDALVDQVEATPAPVDLMEAFAFPLPIAVVCALLGIPPQAHTIVRDFARTALSTGADVTAEERVSAYEAMLGHVTSLIAAKRAEPGDDLLSSMIQVHDDDAGRLSEPELVGTALTLLIGGYENTAHQLGKGLLTLFDHPDQLAALRTDPALIARVVEETMRFTGSLDSGYGSPRYATEDLDVGGTVIPKGATVLVIRASANRDPEQFAEPDTFDVTREAAPHLSFGMGPHFCLGAPLARLEMEIGYLTLIRRLPGLRPAVAVSDIPWAYRLTAAGPARLPVVWDGAEQSR